MKVILLRDVAKIGRRFEIKDVPDGYALNQLIPKKYAEIATPTVVKQIQERNRKGQINSQNEKEKIVQLVEASKIEPLLISMEANDQGHLFQSVQIGDVVLAIKARALIMPETKLQFPSPIKSLGRHEAIIDCEGTRFEIALDIVVKKR